MKVMTFNLRVDLPQDGNHSWVHRRNAVAEMIYKHEPLLLGVQEGLHRMIKDIEKRLPDYRWIGDGRRGGDEDEFCAILYNKRKLEVVDSGQFWLSEQPDLPNSVSWQSDFPRICTWGHFRFRDNPEKTFIHYNTHLDHVSQLARENGSHLIVKKLKEQFEEERFPTILTGDFNSEPQNPVIQYLRGEVSLFEETSRLQDTYSILNEHPGKTFHAFLGGADGKPIDYIFTSPDIGIVNTVIDRSIVDGTYPSDHYPVISTLKI